MIYTRLNTDDSDKDAENRSTNDKNFLTRKGTMLTFAL
jgi:hypothetical protein